jgi:FdhE protein
MREALDDLARLAGDKPALAGPAALLAEILPRLFEQTLATAVSPLSADRARVKLSSGVPLLRGENLQIEPTGFRHCWLSLCEAVQRHQGEIGEKLRLAVEEDRLRPGDLLCHVLAGHLDAIRGPVEALGLDAGLTATVLRLALIPALGPVNTGWLALRRGVPWKEGFCPTCGSWPLLGEFRRLEPVRFLRCGLCMAEWEFPTFTCPFCYVDDQPFQSTFNVDGEDSKYRAATCAACHIYVKMVTTKSPLTGPQLLVADLATMYLDVAAPERGYSAADSDANSRS